MLRYVAVAIFVAAIGFGIALLFVEPPPPSTIRIAAGSAGGAYHGFATRYADLLARSDVHLEVVETAGSVENLRLLQAADNPADLALLQGGLATGTTAAPLETLASVFFEPVWLFYRGADPQQLTDLRGRRVAVGAPGSGTATLVATLLEDNGIGAGDATLVELSSAEAASQLAAGAIDSAFFVSGFQSPLVMELLLTPDVRVMHFDRAAAYAQRHRYMSTVTLHEGAVNPATNIPPRDTVMTAPVASVVAREDLHPALVVLLMQALLETHRDGGIFEAPGAFPSTDFADYPVNAEARRFLERGPPFLQRFLPFWVANFVDRMVVLLIPLATLLLPLLRIVPPVYQWRMRSRVNRIYGELARLEAARHDGQIEDRDAVAQLDDLDARASKITLPPSFMGELHALRFHLDRLRAAFAGDAPA